MRITVYDVLSYLVAGMTQQEILADFPYLTEEDILASLSYAAAQDSGRDRIKEKQETNMTDQSLLARITARPDILAGKPVVQGTRLSVEFILNLLAHGATQNEILAEYDGLVPEDVAACLLFASKSLENTAFMPLSEAA